MTKQYLNGAQPKKLEYMIYDGGIQDM